MLTDPTNMQKRTTVKNQVERSTKAKSLDFDLQTSVTSVSVSVTTVGQ